MRFFLLWLCSNTQLFFLIIFFSLNLTSEPGSRGGVFLLGSVIFSIFTIVLLAEKRLFTKVTFSFLSLMIFIVYFLFNFLFDSQSVSQFREITIGTSGGVVFSLAVGCMSALSIGALIKCCEHSNFYLNLTKNSLLIIILCTLFLVSLIFYKTIGGVRTDLFLIEDQTGLYQRPGKLMLMLYILITTLFASIQHYVRNHIIWNYLTLLLLTFIAIALMAQAQLIGSNSGFVTVAAIMLLIWCYWFFIGTTVFHNHKKAIKLNHLFFSKIAITLIIQITTLLFFIFLCLFLILKKLNLEMSQFRIFGFGTGGSSSVSSRLSILKDNFLTQWDYSPLFGNAIVDELTTGKGSYSHSLISLLSHLGIVGTLLFLVMLVFIYKDIYNKKTIRKSYYYYDKYSLFRLFTLTAVIFFTLLTAFYTWMPLWFTIGLIGVSFPLSLPVKSRRDIKCLS